VVDTSSRSRHACTMTTAVIDPWISPARGVARVGRACVAQVAVAFVPAAARDVSGRLGVSTQCVQCVSLPERTAWRAPPGVRGQLVRRSACPAGLHHSSMPAGVADSSAMLKPLER
jgi:hypothetical protein